MRASVLEEPQTRDRRILWALVLISVGGHVAVGTGLASIPKPVREAMEWVKVEMREIAPLPEEPPPPPPPPPPKPKEKPPTPKEVDISQTSNEPPPPEAPPDAPPPPQRMVQGLTSDSFTASGVGFQVRAGNTTSVRAGDDLMTKDEATGFTTVAYTAIAEAPKLKRKAILDLPAELKKTGIEGRVDVVLTVSASGRAEDIRVVTSLDAAVDAACARDIAASALWKPGLHNGNPVRVTGVPYSCRYEAVR